MSVLVTDQLQPLPNTLTMMMSCLLPVRAQQGLRKSSHAMAVMAPMAAEADLQHHIHVTASKTTITYDAYGFWIT